MPALSMDRNVQLLKILDDQFIFRLADFSIDMQAEYMYISDPPLFADIGNIEFNAKNTTLMLNGRTSFVDSLFNLTVIDTSIDIEPFSLDFNGISDMSDVATRLVNFMGNVMRSRLCSLSKYQPAIYKFNHLFNQIVAIIPDEIDIPNTDLYLQGGISD